MLEENSVSLSQDEWDSFHRKLNRYNPEREQRINTMFLEYDSVVRVRRNDTQTEIDLPWLNDDIMRALLGAPEETPEFDLFLFSSDATQSVNVTTDPVPNCRIDGYTTDSYAQQTNVNTILLAA